MNRPLVLFLVALAVVRLGLSVLDRNPWPLSSYDMFSRTWPSTIRVARVRLVDDRGAEMQVWPGNVIPLEFFRANALIQDAETWDPERRRRFYEAILEELNRGGWSGFDETWEAASPAPGARFVSLSVEMESWTPF